MKINVSLISFIFYFTASQSPINGLGHDPHSSLEQTRMALLKMFGAAPPVSLPNLPPLPGLPADIFQQAQKQQDNALNLHLQRQRAMDEVSFFSESLMYRKLYTIFRYISIFSKKEAITKMPNDLAK